MKYIGNKNKLIKWIFEILINENISFVNKTVLDGFLGTGAFSKAALEKGAKKVYGCDLLKSMCLYATYNVCGTEDYSINKVKESFLRNNVNNGYFYMNFSTDSNRNYFSNDNAKKIDSMLLQ